MKFKLIFFVSSVINSELIFREEAILKDKDYIN